MDTGNKIGICIVHRDRIWRESVSRALGRVRDFNVLETFDADTLLPLVVRVTDARPEVVIVNLDPPSRIGLCLARQLSHTGAGPRILMTGIPDEDQEVMAAIEAGAQGYLTEHSGLDALISNIRAVAAGRSFCSPRIAQLLFSRVAKSAHVRKLREDGELQSSVRLTPREIQIMGLIEEGLSNKEIARRLYIEQQTVKNHVHHILVKLSLRRRTQVAHYVRQRGLSTKSTGPLPTFR